jgi:hypothetical protein
MNRFNFYIFGTPSDFELYPNSATKARYFQKYNDGNYKNIKLVIQRTKTKITYSYYRHVLSGKGKKEAFFGIALEFNYEYCTDIKELFKLLDLVYAEVIVKNGKLLYQN